MRFPAQVLSVVLPLLPAFAAPADAREWNVVKN